jgi:hypothetical protein
MGGVIERVPSTHRQWILINSVLITAFINVVVNATLAALGARGHHIAWWTSNPFTTNLLYNSLGTLFFLPLLTVVGVTPAVAKELEAGSLTPIQSPFASRLWSWACAPSPWRRGVRFGLATLAVLGPVDVVAVVLLGRNGAAASHFVMFQVLFAVVLGAVVAPLCAIAAMSDVDADS